MRKTILQLTIAIALAIVAMVSYLHYSDIFLPFEYKIKDLMFKVRGEIKGNENIIIIDIDEKSLKELGQW